MASHRDLLCQTPADISKVGVGHFTGTVHYAAHDRNPYAFEVCDAAKKNGRDSFGYPARIINPAATN